MNIITKFKEWAGTFLPLTPDQGPQQAKIVDRHSPLDVKKKLATAKKRQIAAATTTDPYYEKMTKRQLEEYARKEFNVELDRRHNKKRLISRIKSLKK
tara:strand:+ start:42 stop:335 length:294 start_codon:yes stop_codon:yes gene_type:complete